MPRFPHLLPLLAVLLAVFVTTIPRATQAQVNDSLHNALSIDLPGSDTRSNVGATSEGVDELTNGCATETKNSIFWKFTPTFTGSVIVETAGSDFDTILSVRTGASHPQTEIACNDDDPGGGTLSVLSFSATSGVTYYIRVVGYNGASGSAVVTVRPASDDLASANIITSIAHSDTVGNQYASHEGGEEIASPGCTADDGLSSLWWSYTATFTDTLIADTDDSNFDTILSVHTGASHPLTEIACNDDVTGSITTSLVKFEATAGVTYHFRVTGYAASVGNVAFRVARQGDRIDFARPIASLPFADTTSSVGTTVPPGDFSPCAPSGISSIWWSYTPSVSGAVIADPRNTSDNANKDLSVWIGSLADYCGPTYWTREFDAVAGTTYYFRIGDYNGSTGPVDFKLKNKGDDLEAAIPVLSLPFADTVLVSGFGSEVNEVSGGCGDSGDSIWWTYDATFTGALVVDTEGSNPTDTWLSTHTGTGHPMTEISCDDDSGSTSGSARDTVSVTQGITYFFKVTGRVYGPVRLRIQRLGPDYLAGATEIMTIPYADTVSNAAAGVEVGEDLVACGNDNGKSMWWRFVPGETGSLTVDTGGSDFDTILSVWLGNGYPLTEVGCNDDGGSPHLRSRLTFTAIQNSTYFIRVTGWGSESGSIVLNANQTVAFAGKIAFEGAHVSTGIMSTPALFDNARTAAQPFVDAAYNGTVFQYDGLEALNVAIDTSKVIDWVLGSLRTGIAASTEVPGSRQALLVLDDGSIVGVDGDSVRFNAAPGLYYVVIRHRNHLAVMSPSPIDFSTRRGSWDFTGVGGAYSTGPPATKWSGVGTYYMMFAGDGNFDGQATASDFNLWLPVTKASQTGYLAPDFNMDGQATASDFNLWLANTKASAASQVPN